MKARMNEGRKGAAMEAAAALDANRERMKEGEWCMQALHTLCCSC